MMIRVWLTTNTFTPDPTDHRSRLFQARTSSLLAETHRHQSCVPTCDASMVVSSFGANGFLKETIISG